MRLFYPGQVALPLMLILAAALMLIEQFGMLQSTRQIAEVWNFWPLALIASGLEELYFWSVSGDDK